MNRNGIPLLVWIIGRWCSTTNMGIPIEFEMTVAFHFHRERDYFPEFRIKSFLLFYRRLATRTTTAISTATDTQSNKHWDDEGEILAEIGVWIDYFIIDCFWLLSVGNYYISIAFAMTTMLCVGLESMRLLRAFDGNPSVAACTTMTGGLMHEIHWCRLSLVVAVLSKFAVHPPNLTGAPEVTVIL